MLSYDSNSKRDVQVKADLARGWAALEFSIYIYHISGIWYIKCSFCSRFVLKARYIVNFDMNTLNINVERFMIIWYYFKHCFELKFSDYNSLRDVHSTLNVLTAYDGVESEIITIIECNIRHSRKRKEKQNFRLGHSNSIVITNTNHNQWWNKSK